MPALPAVPKVIRLDFHAAYGEDPNVMNREFFAYTGTLNTTDATSWLGAAVTGWNTFVASIMQVLFTTKLAELTDLSSNTAPQVENAVSVVGTDTNSPLSAGTALLIKKIIARRYRGGHPRIYLAGFGEGRLSTPQLWNSTQLGTVLAAYTTFVASVISGVPSAAGTATHVNVSYYSGFTNHTFPSGRTKPIPNLRATPLVDPIVGLVPVQNVSSQRRRNQTP